ncbi:MAG: sulfite exporter TauE/SafE family protein [Deltaproteobacteria bacterium]|nr:sulfite exporter TauE/SafE family protein [Deltaproteobacteria bacterium]
MTPPRKTATNGIDPPLELTEIALLIGGGLVAGTVNTLAGGGSLLTVPLLVLCGLPGNLANGSNRVGVLLQNVTAVWSFRAQGVSELRRTIPVLAPLLLGSLIGAGAVSQLSDALFERAFGAVMLLLLVPTFVWQRAEPSSSGTPWSRGTTSGVFFLIGIYGGAFQAGVGLLLLLALARSGLDLVRASALKVAVVGMLTAVSLPVFIANGQVAWLPAALLAIGFSGGGILGARIAVRGGERLIRPVVAVAVVMLAAKMLGLY